MEITLLNHLHAELTHPIAGVDTFVKPKEVPNPEAWMDEVSAFVPIYLEANATLAIFRDKRCWYLPWSVTSMYNRMAREYLTSRVDIRRALDVIVGCYQYVPLIGGLGQIAFVPLKFRSPLVRTDGATGYFNLRDIAKFEMATAKHCTLTLTSGLVIDIPMTKENGDKRIRDTRTLAITLKHRSEYPIQL